MITDFHIHIFPRQDLRKSAFFPADIQAEPEYIKGLLGLAGVDRAIVFGHPDRQFITSELANRFVLDASQRFNNLIPFALIDQHVENNIAMGFKGFKEHCYGQCRLRSSKNKAHFADSYLWKDQYTAIEKAGLPLLIHCGTNGISRIESLLEIAPTINVVCAHLGWHFADNSRPKQIDIEQFLRRFASIPNVFFDISAILKNEAHLIALAFDIIGSVRLLWGSDYPTDGVTPAMALKILESAKLPDYAIIDILEANPRRLLKS